MRILVTGGCGFIGHNVVNQLEQLGHQVRVIDNQTDYGIIPDDEHLYLLNERKKKISYQTIVHQIDIESNVAKMVFEQFSPNMIIHLASFPRQRVVNNDPRRGARVMCEGLLNLLELSLKFQVEKFVYISSSMVYGDFDLDVKEDVDCKPMGQYAIMKLMGEHLVRDYTNRTGISHTIIRPSAVYGELDCVDRVISKFTMAALRDEVLHVNGKSEYLDFTHVDDITNGIVLASLTDQSNNKTYNITRGTSVSLFDAANTIVDLVGKGKIELHDREDCYPKRNSLSNAAALQDFGYSSQIDFSTGIKRYLEWFKNSSFWNKKITYTN